MDLERRHLQLLVETAGKELGRRQEQFEALKAELDLVRLEDHGFRCWLEKSSRNGWRSGGERRELVVGKVESAVEGWKATLKKEERQLDW